MACTGASWDIVLQGRTCRQPALSFFILMTPCSIVHSVQWETPSWLWIQSWKVCDRNWPWLFLCCSAGYVRFTAIRCLRHLYKGSTLRCMNCIYGEPSTWLNNRTYPSRSNVSSDITLRGAFLIVKCLGLLIFLSVVHIFPVRDYKTHRKVIFLYI